MRRLGTFIGFFSCVVTLLATTAVLNDQPNQLANESNNPSVSATPLRDYHIVLAPIPFKDSENSHTTVKTRPVKTASFDAEGGFGDFAFQNDETIFSDPKDEDLSAGAHSEALADSETITTIEPLERSDSLEKIQQPLFGYGVPFQLTINDAIARAIS